MREKIRRLRPTYAGVTATLALVLAVGMGGAYAAGTIGSKEIARSAVKSKHIKDGQVKTSDFAKNATVAKATDALNAGTANEAFDAVLLGGRLAAAYQLRCEPGAIKGSVMIDTSSLPADHSYADVSGFNCEDGAVQVRSRPVAGTYFVRFVDNPDAASAVATASPEGIAASGNSLAVTANRAPDATIGNEGVFLVRVTETGPAPDGGSQLSTGQTFTLLAY